MLRLLVVPLFLVFTAGQEQETQTVAMETICGSEINSGKTCCFGYAHGLSRVYMTCGKVEVIFDKIKVYRYNVEVPKVKPKEKPKPKPKKRKGDKRVI
jgi:hypothetical protein